MENRLLDKYEVAAMIGGISPRTASDLMLTMPCINVSTGEQRKRLRVYQTDLETWLEKRKAPACSASLPAQARTRTAGRKHTRDEGLDENGFILKRHSGR